ncbi:RNA recognition motif domain-containing protein [Acidobacteriota bacterium]
MQGSKLYVGNFSYSVTKEHLEELFAKYEIREIRVIEGKGFGFVEFSSPTEAENAKQALNGKEYTGRTLRIDEARPRGDRSSDHRRGSGYNRF